MVPIERSFRVAAAVVAALALATFLPVAEAVTVGPRSVRIASNTLSRAIGSAMEAAPRGVRQAAAVLKEPSSSSSQESQAGRASSLYGTSQQSSFTAGRHALDSSLNAAGLKPVSSGTPEKGSSELGEKSAVQVFANHANLTPEERKALPLFEKKYAKVRQQAKMAGQRLNKDRDSRGFLNQGAVARAVKYANENFKE